MEAAPGSGGLGWRPGLGPGGGRDSDFSPRARAPLCPKQRPALFQGERPCRCEATFQSRTPGLRESARGLEPRASPGPRPTSPRSSEGWSAWDLPPGSDHRNSLSWGVVPLMGCFSRIYGLWGTDFLRDWVMSGL